MIEPIMFVGLGFLAASLLALIIIPLVHARAIRLTKRRLEASIPVSVTEIQADKDQLRAEFAMSTRRLEMSVDQLRTKTAAQLVELGKKTEALNALQAELADKTASLDSLDTRDQTLLDQLKTAKGQLGTTTNALREAERKLADTVTELDKARTDLAERSVTCESQHIETVTLQTQVATLKNQVVDFEQQVKQTEATLARERTDAERVRDERARLQRDFSAYKQETEAENATMRERINDVAAQVAQLTIALEGPGSPIETVLAADTIGRPTQGRGAAGAAGEAVPAGMASLADRIRALQSSGSRMAAPTRKGAR